MRSGPRELDPRYVDMVVIEFLTFDVDPSERDEWLHHEEQHWSRFLERQPGFVRKQMWQAADDPSALHAVIWWESMEHWEAIPQIRLEEVAAAMGARERSATSRAFEVIRDC